MVLEQTLVLEGCVETLAGDPTVKIGFVPGKFVPPGDRSLISVSTSLPLQLVEFAIAAKISDFVPAFIPV